MKALHVLFLIALISCVQFNFQNKIFINDVNVIEMIMLMQLLPLKPKNK